MPERAVEEDLGGWLRLGLTAAALVALPSWVVLAVALAELHAHEPPTDEEVLAELMGGAPPEAGIRAEDVVRGGMEAGAVVLVALSLVGGALGVGALVRGLRPGAPARSLVTLPSDAQVVVRRAGEPLSPSSAKAPASDEGPVTRA